MKFKQVSVATLPFTDDDNFCVVYCAVDELGIAWTGYSGIDDALEDIEWKRLPAHPFSSKYVLQREDAADAWETMLARVERDDGSPPPDYVLAYRKSHPLPRRSGEPWTCTICGSFNGKQRTECRFCQAAVPPLDDKDA